jgi:hypothetical protein
VKLITRSQKLLPSALPQTLLTVSGLELIKILVLYEAPIVTFTSVI